MATGDLNIGGINLSPEDLDKLSNEITNRLHTTAKDPGQYEVAQSLSGISSIPVFQQSGSSYKLVRVLLETLKGVDGKSVKLRISSDKLQWANEGSEAWSDLYSKSDLLGEPGKNPVFREGQSGLEYKLEGEADSAYKLLIPFSRLTGPAGDYYVFRVSRGWLQTKLSNAGEGAYINIFDLSTLKGDKGDPGPAPVLELGTVATVKPSDPASATFEPNGTDLSGANKYRLNLSIPKGKAGQDGTGAGNVLVGNEAALLAAKQYAFKPGQDGSVNGSFVEVEATEGAVRIDLNTFSGEELTDEQIKLLEDASIKGCYILISDDSTQAAVPACVQKDIGSNGVITYILNTAVHQIPDDRSFFTTTGLQIVADAFSKTIKSTATPDVRIELSGSGDKFLSDNGSYKSTLMDAPADGKTYARKNKKWSEVFSNTAYLLDLSPLFDSEANPVNVVSDEFMAELQKAYEAKCCNAISPEGDFAPISLGKSDMNYNLSIAEVYMDPLQSKKPIYINTIDFNIVISTKEVKSAFGRIDLINFEDGTKALMDDGAYHEVTKEAPKDGKTYARKDGAWSEVLLNPSAFANIHHLDIDFAGKISQLPEKDQIISFGKVYTAATSDNIVSLLGGIEGVRNLCEKLKPSNNPIVTVPYLTYIFPTNMVSTSVSLSTFNSTINPNFAPLQDGCAINLIIYFYMWPLDMQVAMVQITIDHFNTPEQTVLYGYTEDNLITVENGLTSNDSTSALSACQGKVLKEYVDKKVGSEEVTTLRKLTQSAYQALSTKDSKTLYACIQTDGTIVMR